MIDTNGVQGEWAGWQAAAVGTQGSAGQLKVCVASHYAPGVTVPRPAAFALLHVPACLPAVTAVVALVRAFTPGMVARNAGEARLRWSARLWSASRCQPHCLSFIQPPASHQLTLARHTNTAGHLIFMSSIAAHEAYGKLIAGCWLQHMGAAQLMYAEPQSAFSPAASLPLLAPIPHPPPPPPRRRRRGLHRHQARHRCSGQLGWVGDAAAGRQAVRQGSHGVGVARSRRQDRGAPPTLATSLLPMHRSPWPRACPRSAPRRGGHPPAADPTLGLLPCLPPQRGTTWWPPTSGSPPSAPAPSRQSSGGGGRVRAGCLRARRDASRRATLSGSEGCGGLCPSLAHVLPARPPAPQRGAVQGRRGQGGRRVRGHPPAAGRGWDLHRRRGLPRRRGPRKLRAAPARPAPQHEAMHCPTMPDAAQPPTFQPSLSNLHPPPPHHHHHHHQTLRTTCCTRPRGRRTCRCARSWCSPPTSAAPRAWPECWPSRSSGPAGAAGGGGAVPGCRLGRTAAHPARRADCRLYTPCTFL